MQTDHKDSSIKSAFISPGQDSLIYPFIKSRQEDPSTTTKMRVSCFLTLLSTAFVAAAPGTVPAADAESYIITGPLPYEELKAEVANLKNTDESNAARSLDKRICLGVYLCDGTNFTGECYYACYPVGKGIYPDSYWVSRITSVGPDQGGQCDFYAAGANSDPTKGRHQIFRYPGGNLASGIDNNMGCFYCNPV
ncbi:uncharacterized protein CTRU02_200784 [Colletotrichum truncatum]|uniref:Uncharacterized protein n=1 Tax=Colletotrichum truncatum TaxID=5467 RepID=A0ACC3ZFH5_COLTU|nr:uncharacterized protein CTRU02_00552 [Colletotrichum truncatum]KAF6801803.1 hypothetical protein CTRU02_00552 [Colletotrichum truncatum]